MEHATGQHVDRVVASGGGAKSALWLKIKASQYGIPILVPREPECSVVGCAILAATASGRFNCIDEAVAAYVRHDAEVLPDPAWAETYRRMQPIFDRLYVTAQGFYDDLDRLTP
jgi:xylulokinase